MKNISKSQLKQWMDQKQDLLLIDVLPKDDYAEQHIPSAINVPFKDNTDFVQEVKRYASSEKQPIVVYCASTQCNASEQAAQSLEKAGFTNVQRFEEGVEGWFGKSGVSSGKAAA